MMWKPYALALLLTSLLAFLVFGCGGGGGGNALYMLSVTRAKMLNDGLLSYTFDWDDAMPIADSWMDAITPYVDDPNAFHSPRVASPGYGYAFNEDLAGNYLNNFGDTEHTITIFDSTDLSRNATRSTVEQPVPPRYGSSNTLAYLDGHVKDELGENPPPPSLYDQSRTRLARVNLGMLMYSTDYDDYAPLAGQWMDQMSPYVNQESAFRSPAVERLDPTKYGYAFNVDLSGTSLSQGNPANTISFFDSTVLTRNATAPTTTLPVPFRYVTRNTIAHADGSVAP